MPFDLVGVGVQFDVRIRREVRLREIHLDRGRFGDGKLISDTHFHLFESTKAIIRREIENRDDERVKERRRETNGGRGGVGDLGDGFHL